MGPYNLGELPKQSRIRAARHGSDGLLIHFPIPVRGLIALLALGVSLYVVPKFLAKLAVARVQNGAQPVDAAVWIVGTSIVIGAAVSALIVNWIWPHLKYSWFYRTNILVEPGRIVVGRVGILGKFDIAFDASQGPAARHVVLRRWGVARTVEIFGVAGGTRFAESCSEEERNWLVETINAIVKRQPSSVAQTSSRVPAQHSKSFDPYEIAADSPILIDENSSGTMRCHFAPHRGPLTWISAVTLVGFTLGALSLFFLGDELNRWKDPAGQVPTEAAVVLGVLVAISSVPAAVGLWLLCDRTSVTLTPKQLTFRRHLGPIGRRWIVPVRAIDAITCRAYADREIARQIHARNQAPDAAQLDSCVVRYGDGHLLLTCDKHVDPILGSLLRGKLVEWGRPIRED